MRGTERTAWANEVVPLAQRLRYLEMFRGAAALLVIVGAKLWGRGVVSLRHVVVSTLVYGAVAVIGGVSWRLFRRRGLTLFGALIILDGVYLAWVAYATGGTASPLRYLIVLHVVTVTLLASYRTGLKLALWHSLLLLAVYHLEGERILAASSGKLAQDVGSTAAFMTILWLAALLTATFAAVNERELRRRKADVEGLAVMAAELEAVSEPDAVSEVLVANVRSHFGFERVAVLKANDRELSLSAFEGPSEPVPVSFEARRGSVLLEVLRKRTTRLVSELDPDRDRELASILPDARNVAIVPMKSETTVGVLLAECGPRNAKMARRSVEMLIRFASHGALALRNAQLLEEMKTLASTDALTGVANRRTFDAVLAWEIRRAKRSRKPVSLILADVDHFKTLNDAQGHGVGDRALQELASLLTNNVRSVDSVARIGGEEFAIVMPECGVKEAAARAELVRKTLADGKGPHKLTVSLGVAAYPDNAVDGSNLLIAADKALYASKCAGRNKVSISAEGSSRPSGKRQRNVRPKNVRVAEGSRR